MIAGVISGAITAALALILAYYITRENATDGPIAVITPIPFEEQTARGALNASALVPFADSTFLVVDDLTDDAFFELTFGPDGEKAGPLVRRPIAGLAQGLVEDLEGATMVERDGGRSIVAVSSLEASEGENTSAGLVRVRLDDAGRLEGEVMPGFRDWLLASYPILTELPEGGSALDVQGLIWDPQREALLLGIRNPTRGGEPLVLPIRVTNWAGPWQTSSLEALPPISLRISDGGAPKGILAIARHPRTGEFVIIVGNATGKAKNAAMYLWDGRGGEVRRVSELLFHPEMKPEGLAFGTIGGRPAAVIVDDRGGYYTLRLEELNAALGAFMSW